MLDDRGDRADRQRILRRSRIRHIFLIRYAELSASGADQRSACLIVARLHDIEGDAFLFKIALFLSDIDPGVIGVGHIVEDQGHFAILPFISCRAAGAQAACQQGAA